MGNRILRRLLGITCCSFLLISCGGGGGTSAPPAGPTASINLSSSELEFGNVVLNDYLEKEIIINNPGSVKLVLGNIAANNTLASPFFIWSDGCSGNTLEETQLCIMKVRFYPTIIGSGLNDTFDIPSNASNTVTVSVSGNGIAPPPPPPPPTPPPPSIIVSRNDVDFGDVDLNSSSDMPISIKNAGSLNLQIGQIAQIDPLATPFSIGSDNCSNHTLAANNTCPFIVMFSPTIQGKISGDSFDIPSNDPNKPSQVMVVRGKGKTSIPPPQGIILSSNNLAFGNVVWNNVSEQTILIENTGSAGSNDLVIGQIANSNPLVAPFSISIDNCSGKHLTPTQTCALQVRFSPTNQGSGLSDSFDIPSNDPNRPSVGVNVSGNGRALRVSLNEIRTNSCPDISFLLNVLDKDGFPISGLQQDNIAISENGVFKSITNFSFIPSPLSVSAALVIDYSGSLDFVRSEVTSSSKEFIDQLNPGDKAAIFSFSSEVELQQSFTDNITALKIAIDNGSKVGDGTLLYDALWSAIDNAATQTNNRVIILLSDGKDEAPVTGGPGSVKTLTEVINFAKESGVTIFTLGIGVVEIDVMTQLANETGGQFYRVEDASKLGNIYTAIRNILSGDYTVVYQSSASGSILLDVFVDSNGMQGEVSRQVQGCP